LDADASQIGDRLRIARGDMSQKEAADRFRQIAAKRGFSSRLHSQTLSNYERGVIAKVPHQVIEILAEIYGVPISNLLSWEAGRLGGNVSRGTLTTNYDATMTRALRINAFEREMIELGANQDDLDQVRAKSRNHVESMHSFEGTDPDEDLETFLRFSLKPWVLKRIEQRRNRGEE
jgi:transcriptional regulator with XRE-family HTH domain